MSLPTYGACRMATWILGGLAAIVLAMDPTVKVAIIVAIPSAITGIGTLVLGILNRNKLGDVAVLVDGKLSRLLEEKDRQGVELSDKSDQLSHAQGRREGVEASDKKRK